MTYHSGQDPEESLPDWLKALRKRQSQEPTSPEGEDSSAPEPDEEEPDWLRDIRQRYGFPESGPETDSHQKPENALSDTQPIIPSRAVETRPNHEREVFSQGPMAEEPIEDTPEQPSQEWINEEPAAEVPQPESPRREFPDWLEELGEVEGTAIKEDELAPHIPAFTEGTEPELIPGVLPSWLEAIRPGGAFPQEDTRSEEMLPSAEKIGGPLAGLSGVLPAEPDAIQSFKPPVYSARLEVTDSQSQHAAAFKKMLEEEGKPKGDQGHQVALPIRLINTLIGTAIFVAVLVPLLSQSQLAPRPEPDLLPENAAVFNRIDVLPSEAPVLIGLDLQPALYGETKAAITAVINHLLERQARLVFISTQPTGPGIVERLLQEELANQPAGAEGNYTNLGYLSGGMAALRSFFSDPRSATVSMSALGLNPWTSPAFDSIDSVSDFALVLVVSSNADDARIWIEQGASEFPNGLIAITSAQAAPLLRPYLQGVPQTLQGIVSGVQGAVLYERLRSQEVGGGRDLWDAYSFGLGAILLLILLGGLSGRLTHMRLERTATKITYTEPETKPAGDQLGN